MWQVRVSVGYRPDGGQRRVTEYVHGDERDADTAILRLAASMRKNVNLGRGTDLDTYFWVQFAPGRRASTTRANAETCGASTGATSVRTSAGGPWTRSTTGRSSAGSHATSPER